MSFLGFARVFRGPVLLNRVCSVAFLPGRVSRCGMASKKAKKAEPSKRPPTPFARFASEEYQSIRKENPKAKPQEAFGLLAKKWKDLPETEKDRYKSDFEKKLADFNAPLRKIPSRPPTAFAQFVRDNYAAVQSENPEADAPAVIKAIAEKWKEVSENEKESFKEAYLAEKREYEQRVVEFDENLSDDERTFLEHHKEKKMLKLYKERLKILNFPKRPASSFALFLSMEKDRYPREADEKVTEWVKRMAGTWKKMTEKDKELYQRERLMSVEAYGKEVLDWQKKHEQ